MRRKYKTGWAVFLLRTLLLAVVCTILYTYFFFAPFHGRSPKDSFTLLAATVLLSVILYSLVFWRKRSFTDSIIAIALPIGLYTVTANIFMNLDFTATVLTVACCISMAYCIIILTEKIRKDCEVSGIVFKRLRRCLYGSTVILTLALSVVFVGLNMDGALHNQYIPELISTVAPFDESKSDKTVADNIDLIAPLQSEENWNALSLQQKLDVMQAVANIEALRLGIPYQINVISRTLAYGTVGSYQNEDKTIFIDSAYLEQSEPKDALDTILHECYHSYQFCIVAVLNSADPSYHNMPFFDSAFAYRQELFNYISGSESYDDYYNQQCEQDAREYSEKTSEIYLSQISELLE